MGQRLIYSRSCSSDTAFPPTLTCPPPIQTQTPEKTWTTTPSRPRSLKSWAGGARHAGRGSLGVLHLPQEPVRGRRVDGEDGVRMRWELPARALSPNSSLSVLCGSGGAHAHSLPFSKVRQRKSPPPPPSPPSPTELCSSSSDIQPGVVPGRAGPT